MVPDELELELVLRLLQVLQLVLRLLQVLSLELQDEN